MHRDVQIDSYGRPCLAGEGHGRAIPYNAVRAHAGAQA